MFKGFKTIKAVRSFEQWLPSVAMAVSWLLQVNTGIEQKGCEGFFPWGIVNLVKKQNKTKAKNKIVCVFWAVHCFLGVIYKVCF